MAAEVDSSHQPCEFTFRDRKAAQTTTATVEESPRKGRTDLLKTVAVPVNEEMMASVVRVDPAKLVAPLVEQA